MDHRCTEKCDGKASRCGETGGAVEQEKGIWDGFNRLCAAASLLLLDHALDDLRLLDEERTDDTALYILVA